MSAPPALMDLLRAQHVPRPGRTLMCVCGAAIGSTPACRELRALLGGGAGPPIRSTYPQLLALLSAQHPRNGMQTAKSCICGAAGGGPAGTPACHEFLDLLEALKEAKRETR